MMCERYFGIPQSAVRLGKVKALSPSAIKLYIALWHESERYSTRELKRTVAQLQRLVGGSRNSYTKAKCELTQAGLLSAEAYGTEGFIFHLFDPKTGKPWPLSPKEKPPYLRKGVAAASSSQPQPKSTAPQRVSNTGTDFAFGHNDPQSASATPSHESSNPVLSWDQIGK